MAARHSHSSTLFVTQDGAPMRFYVRPGPLKRQLAPLITHGGGVVCRIQEPGAFLLADPAEGQLGPGYISTKYVSDCVGSNRCLSPRAYRLLPPWGQKTRTGQSHKVYSTLTPSQRVPGWARPQTSSAIDLTSKGDATLQGDMDACTAMGITTRDQTKSAVGLTNKGDAMIQGERDACTAMVITTRDQTKSAVDQTNKDEAPIQQHMDTCTPGVTATDIVDQTNKDEAPIQQHMATCTSGVTTTDIVDQTNKDEAPIQQYMDTCTPGVTATDVVELTNKDQAPIQQFMATCTSMVITTTDQTSSAIDLTNKDQAPIQQYMDTCTSGGTITDVVDLTNKDEAPIQQYMATCTSGVTTTEEAAGGLEHNLEQMRNLITEWTRGDKEDLQECSAVDMTSKVETTIKRSSIVTTIEETSEEREDKMEPMGNLSSERTRENKEDLKEGSVVDVISKLETTIKHPSIVITTEETSGEQEDNMEQMGNPNQKSTHGDEEELECFAVDLTKEKGNGETSKSVGTTPKGATSKEDSMEQMGNPSSERTCEDEEDLKEGSAVELTNKVAAIQSNKETSNSMSAIGKQEDNIEQIGNSSLKCTHGNKEDLKERSAFDLTNKEKATIQGQFGTDPLNNTIQGQSMVTTTEEAPVEQEGNQEQMGNPSSERTREDKEFLEECSVDMIDKEAVIPGRRETCTSMVTTAKGATGRREDNMEQMGNPSSKITHGDEEDLEELSAIDLTKEAPIQGSRETCNSIVTTTKETNGNQEENIKKMRSLVSERSIGDEEVPKGSSSVDLTKKEGRAILERIGSSIVTTIKETTGEDNMKQGIATSGPAAKTLADISPILIEGAFGSEQDLKTTALSIDDICTRVANRDERDKIADQTHSTCSGAQKKHPSFKKVDVEQTLNEDENYSMLLIPDPRTSTPASGIPNTVKDLETDMADDSDFGKEEKSHLDTEFRRPERKVAIKIRSSKRVNQHSPNKEQYRAEKQIDVHKKPRDETSMSVKESHSGQAVQKSSIGEAQISNLENNDLQDQTEEPAQSPKSSVQMVPNSEVWPSIEKCTVLNPDLQNADMQQGQPFVSLQGPKSPSALRKGRMAFTKEEDLAILLYIRDNVSSRCTVTGNVIWKEMEKNKVLGRTWQAMKARYVKYLVNYKSKYKLPSKCPSLLNKESSCSGIEGLAKTNSLLPNCASASIGTAQKCDTSNDVPQNRAATLPSASDGGPQNRASTLPSASDGGPQNRASTLPSASDGGPQNRASILPSASDGVPQNCASTLPSASDGVPQNHGTTLPSAYGVPQKRDATLPSASDGVPQNRDTTLHSTSAFSPQNLDTVPPSASTHSPQKGRLMPSIACTQKCDAILPSSSTDRPPNEDRMPPTTSAVLQKGDSILPSTSADTYQSCRVVQHRASLSTNTLANNIVLKKLSTFTPKKRSCDPTNDESSPPEKGNKMSRGQHSLKTVVSHKDDSSDLEDLRIFENANMEFEDTDDDTIIESQALSATQTEDQNSVDHVDETPSTSRACESEDLLEAMIDMMREFKLDASCITQALFFNNGELGSTRHFLRTGARPDGYPVWEPQDDLDLQKSNPKTQYHLIDKYGADNVARRVAFLAS